MDGVTETKLMRGIFRNETTLEKILPYELALNISVRNTFFYPD